MTWARNCRSRVSSFPSAAEASAAWTKALVFSGMRDGFPARPCAEEVRCRVEVGIWNWDPYHLRLKDNLLAVIEGEPEASQGALTNEG
jgi:hypothetical protein